jgi:hypothetical protein
MKNRITNQHFNVRHFNKPFTAQLAYNGTPDMGRTVSAGLQQMVVQVGHQHAKSPHLHKIIT